MKMSVVPRAKGKGFAAILSASIFLFLFPSISTVFLIEADLIFPLSASDLSCPLFLHLIGEMRWV